MSTIAGVLHLDGSAADPALIEEMSRRALSAKPLRSSTVVRGPIGFAVTAATDRGRDGERIASSADGSRWAILDGVIDNREELFRDLHLAHGGIPDAELLLRCYEAWEAGCIRRIIGDFGFAIWDAGQNRLLCARDALGVRPLYYARHGTKLLFATQIEQLFADDETNGDIDPEFFADYLVSGLAVREPTPYPESNDFHLHTSSSPAAAR